MMQEDFHYYATYAAAYLAGYTHEESLEICYSAQLVDLCSAAFLRRISAPAAAATTQLQLELMDSRSDPAALQDITRIWASFHFLPGDLYAPCRGGRRYRSKYRLICGPNGELLKDTVQLAMNKGTQAAGLAMHVLADTWAHSYFAGTPSLVINNTTYDFYELIGSGEDARERRVDFRHNPSAPDDLEAGKYTNSVYQSSENHVMNLGHGRAGHLPDYSFIKYRYLPAWNSYDYVTKDNPADYMRAFCQMIYALRCLRGDHPAFETDTYDFETIEPYRDRIESILRKRQLSASADWEKFGSELSGKSIPAFDPDRYIAAYNDAPDSGKKSSYLGKFILAALSQKSMVTNRIFTSGNMLAGVSVDFRKKGFRGMKDFAELAEQAAKNTANDVFKDGGEQR